MAQADTGQTASTGRIVEGCSCESTKCADLRDSTPVVSVVITCYNQAHFLGDAIQSVLAQTYEPIEIVVVDDGSTDDTCDRAGSFPDVNVTRQTNQGLSAARNTGIRVSKGDYLVFLDADDRLLPDGIAAGVACFQSRSNCGMIFGGFRFINGDGSVRRNVIRRPLSAGLYRELLSSNYILMHGSVMYKRSTLDAIGPFNTSLRAAEDYDLYLRIASKFPVASHGVVVAEYRQHGSNMSLDSCLMTQATLSVLESQSRNVAADARLEQAYYDGIARTKTHYMQKLIVQAFTNLQAPAWRSLTHLSIRRPDLLATSLIKGLDRYLRLSDLATITAASVRRRIVRLWRTKSAASFPRRLTPVSREFGFDLGLPVDRYYVECFLERNASVVRGRVLEIGDDSYTRRFGDHRVTCRDVLSVKDDRSGKTIVADLSSPDNIESDTYDCIILTQTLHLIYDFHSALVNLHRILRPGGVLLVTVPGISPLSKDEWKDSWYWSFTTLSMRRMLDETFGPMVEVQADGNVLAATAFLQGMPASDLTTEELNYHDPQFELLICVKATKLNPSAYTRTI